MSKLFKTGVFCGPNALGAEEVQGRYYEKKEPPPYLATWQQMMDECKAEGNMWSYAADSYQEQWGKGAGCCKGSQTKRFGERNFCCLRRQDINDPTSPLVCETREENVFTEEGCKKVAPAPPFDKCHTLSRVDGKLVCRTNPECLTTVCQGQSWGPQYDFLKGCIRNAFDYSGKEGKTAAEMGYGSAQDAIGQCIIDPVCAQPKCQAKLGPCGKINLATWECEIDKDCEAKRKKNEPVPPIVVCKPGMVKSASGSCVTPSTPPKTPPPAKVPQSTKMDPKWIFLGVVGIVAVGAVAYKAKKKKQASKKA